MKSRIIVVICFLLSFVPVFSFAQDKKRPDLNVSAHEHTHENVQSQHSQYLLYKKEKKEARAAERLAEKRAKKSDQLRKEAEEAQNKAQRKLKENDSSPNMSAYEHAHENAKFKRTRDLFYNEENKEARDEKLTEKKAEKEAEIKKKAEEAQDKGEGQFKLEF